MTKSFWRTAFYLIWTGLLVWILVVQVLPLFQVAGLLGAASILVFLMQLLLIGTPLLLVVLQLRGPSFGRWLTLLFFSLAGGLVLLLFFWGQGGRVGLVLLLWSVHVVWLLLIRDAPHSPN